MSPTDMSDNHDSQHRLPGSKIFLEISGILYFSTQQKHDRALGRHFFLRVRGPHHLNFQGPQAKFEGSLHWNTLPILRFGRVHWGFRQNSQGPHWIFRGPGPLHPAPPQETCMRWWKHINTTLNDIPIISAIFTINREDKMYTKSSKLKPKCRAVHA